MDDGRMQALAMQLRSGPLALYSVKGAGTLQGASSVFCYPRQPPDDDITTSTTEMSPACLIRSPQSTR